VPFAVDGFPAETGESNKNMGKLECFCILFCILGGCNIEHILPRKRYCPMKNTFSRIQFLASKIDRRHIQFAYFVLMLAGFIVTKAPSDGGGGPY